MGGQPAQLVALEADRSGSRGHEPHDGADGRGLAHSVAPHESHHLPHPDLEVDTEQDLARAVGRLQPRDLEHYPSPPR